MTVARLITVFVATAASLGLLAGPASAGAVHFQTSSHQIACWAQDGWLRCDVDKPRHKLKKPKGCELDYGNAFGLTARGKGRRLCVGDTVLDRKAPVLRPGKTKRFSGYACRATSTSLRCTNKARHGFEISRARQRVF